MSKDDSEAVAESEGDETLLRIARAALAAYDLPPQLDVRPIRLVNNAVFEVVAVGALRLALRIHRAGYRAVEHIQSELTFLQTLADQVVGTSVEVRQRPWRGAGMSLDAPSRGHRKLLDSRGRVCGIVPRAAGYTSALVMRVERVDFVSFLTQDMARAKHFYAEVLGLEIESEGEHDIEFCAGQVTLDIFNPASIGQAFAPSPAGLALRVPDVAVARAALEARGVEFDGQTLDTGVCHMAYFRDPDGNALMLHRRYAPFEDGREP